MRNLLYGLNQDKELVSVYDVVKGLSCKCTCPGCGGQLIARQGEQKQWHFAHYNAEECATGYQTSIHLLAKEIIKKNKKILIPVSKYKGFVINYDMDGPENYGYSYCGLCYTFPPLSIGIYKRTEWHCIPLDDVYLEQKEGDIIPDIVGIAKGRKLLIEIYVTHKVDAKKLEKIRSLGLSCIEIDLSKLDKDINKDVLEKEIYDRSKIVSLYNVKDFNTLQSAIADFGKKNIKPEKRFYKKNFHCQICGRSVRSKDGTYPVFRLAEVSFCEKCWSERVSRALKYGSSADDPDFQLEDG